MRWSRASTEDRAAGLRRAPAVRTDSMVMTNMKPKRLLFSTASKRAPQTIRRAEKEDLTINSGDRAPRDGPLVRLAGFEAAETRRRAIFRDGRGY